MRVFALYLQNLYSKNIMLFTQINTLNPSFYLEHKLSFLTYFLTRLY
jgi:hypothetical protein